MVLGIPPSAPGSSLGWRAWTSRILAALCALGVMAGVARAAERQTLAPQTPPTRVEGAQPVPKVEGRHPSYVVKAGYLYKLIPFVDWPDAAFETADSPFRLCIAGRDPFGGAAEHAARGARVGDHRVVVIRMPAVAKGAPCHILFLAASPTQTPQQMLAMVAGQPVLTVADEALDAPGAVVQFTTIESRIRFEIRPDAAQPAGLTISSKLLSLAAPAAKDGAKGGGK